MNYHRVLTRVTGIVTDTADPISCGARVAHQLYLLTNTFIVFSSMGSELITSYLVLIVFFFSFLLAIKVSLVLIGCSWSDLDCFKIGRSNKMFLRVVSLPESLDACFLLIIYRRLLFIH